MAGGSAVATSMMHKQNNTDRALRILFIEDSPADFSLAERALRREWLSLVSRCEQDAGGVARALEEFTPDIVISDYSMPKFDGLSALKLCRKILPGVPFILHTAALDDEAAGICIRAGADDYVLKQNLAHLPLSVANALERRRARVAEEKLLAAQKLAEVRAQHESALFSQLISTIPDRIYFKDLQCRFLKANDAVLRQFGLHDPSDVIGRSDADFFPEEYVRKSLADDARVIATGQNLVGREEVQILPDGTTRCFSTTKVPLRDRDGKVIGLMGVTRDITGLKATENRLRELNEQLQSTLERAEELAEKAEAANRAKSEFLAVMSHELRTPLNGVLGFAELLSFGPLNAEQQTYAQTISASGQHLLSVVSDILDFSSIEKGRMPIEPAPLTIAGLVKSSVLACRQVAMDKGLEFLCEVAEGVPEQIVGDERRIRQILINLLANAVKFTSSGSVFLRVAPSPTGGPPALDFSVTDTGMGISPEMIDFLFQPFAQGDSTIRRQFGGTGLGLAISQRLAEAMGGSISIVSTPGNGSRFTLRLPFEISAGGMAPVPPHLFLAADGASHSSPSRKTPPPRIPGELVLVVEDDPDNSSLACKMLLSLGYRTEFAANGAEAVEAFAPGKYFAILMDILMPGMDGLVATRQIRARESGSRVPIIALTANVMPGDRDRCLAAGMDDFLAKPFKRAELADKLACVALPSTRPS